MRIATADGSFFRQSAVIASLTVRVWSNEFVRQIGGSRVAAVMIR